MDVLEKSGEPLAPIMKMCGTCDYREATTAETCPRCRKPLVDKNYARTSALLPLLGGIGMVMTGIVGGVSAKQAFATRTTFRADDALYLKMSVTLFVFVGVFGLAMLGFAALQMKTGKLYRRTTRTLFIGIPAVMLLIEIYFAFVALR